MAEGAGYQMNATDYNRNPCAGIPSTIMGAYQGRTILITGGRGYIGSALSQALAELNCKLILLDQSPGES